MPEFESPENSGEIREICIRLLTRREHSQKELRDKLALRGFDRGQTQTVIDGLIEQNWQSDQRFAESYARHRIKKGYGPVKIEYEIQQRGIQSVDLDAVLVDLADDWFEVLGQVYRKKYAEASLKNYAERIKRSRFLLQRGFSGEMIRKFLQQIENKSHI